MKQATEILGQKKKIAGLLVDCVYTVFSQVLKNLNVLVGVSKGYCEAIIREFVTVRKPPPQKKTQQSCIFPLNGIGATVKSGSFPECFGYVAYTNSFDGDVLKFVMLVNMRAANR